MSKIINLDSTVNFELKYVPPYHWEHIFKFLKSHQVSGCEFFTENSYQRYFSIRKNQLSYVIVTNKLQKKCLDVEVHNVATNDLPAIKSVLRRMFDLDIDPKIISRAFAKSEFVNSIFSKHPGLRVPSGWDVFETLICTILGQFVSMQMAGSLINQLVQLHGRKISETVILFPKAKVLANADLTALKTTNARKQTIKDVSKKFESQEISAAHYATPKIFREKILQIKGIGP